MLGDLWVDHLGAKRLEPTQRAVLVGLDQPRITRDIGGEGSRRDGGWQPL
jgi:hypothetical protein